MRRGSTTAPVSVCPPIAIRELDAAGAPKAIRFKVPASGAAFDDAVHGPIAFDGASIEDFVILRSDQYPTYHLSVVVDDTDMGITDVIRGDDHISNTPKHVLLFQALGASVPRFAHVPLILGADKKRLSKRHGATSVMEYQRQGYLAPAVVNFLALLGWSPGDDRELMTTQELIDSFTLEGISGGNAVFNTEKLDWMNGQYIARMPIEDLAAAAKPFFDDAGLGSHPLVTEARAFHRLLELLRPRAKRLTDFAEQARPLLTEVVAYEQEAVDKHLTSPDLAGHIVALVRCARVRDAVRRGAGRSGRAGDRIGARDQGRRADSRHAGRGDRSHAESRTVRSPGMARAGSRSGSTRTIAGISRRPRLIGAGRLCGRRAVRYNWRFLPSPRPRPYWEVVQR